MQQSFELPELDRKRTQAAVEAALEKYRIFKTVYFEEKEAIITASYSDMPRAVTGITSDQTANVAIHNVDVPAERKAYCEKIERAVRRLHPKERLLIEARYMQDAYEDDYVNDMKVYSYVFSPQISRNTYDKIRWKAFYKLALILNIQVEKDSENGAS